MAKEVMKFTVGLDGLDAVVAALPRDGIVLLRGDLGSGKTTLVRAIAHARGLGGVSSPTFSIMQAYGTGDGFGEALCGDSGESNSEKNIKNSGENLGEMSNSNSQNLSANSDSKNANLDANLKAKKARPSIPKNAQIYHYDIYQNGVDSLMSNGLFENFDAPGLHIIEWADERLQAILWQYGYKYTQVAITGSGAARTYEVKLA